MLTDTKARKLRPGEEPLLVGGVTGLYLRSGSAIGSGKLILRFVSPETGKRRDMGLGVYPTIGLTKSRATAIEARQLIAQGIDSIENRKRGQIAERRASEIPTFEEVALRVYESIAPSFRNRKHRAQ